MKKLKLLVASLAIATVGTAQVNILGGLRACYPLDCDSAQNYAPATAPGLHGTLFNVSCTAGHTGAASTGYRFAGTTSSYIQLPNDARLKPDTLSFTSWVYTDTLISQYILFTNNNCTSYHEGYALLIDNTGTPTGGYRFQVVKSDGSCSSAGQVYFNGSTNLSKRTWYHVGFYLGNDSIKIYVNGALDGSRAIAINFNYNTNRNVYFGGTNLAYNRPFKGVLDNARFYNRKLNGNEFSYIYVHDPGCANREREMATGLSNESLNWPDDGLIYPNPASDNIAIRSENESGPVDVKISDITGKTVFTKTIRDASGQQLDISELKAGMYLVELKNSDNKITIKKLIKN